LKIEARGNKLLPLNNTHANLRTNAEAQPSPQGEAGSFIHIDDQLAPIKFCTTLLQTVLSPQNLS
jgi:hypothetical protein